MTFKPGQVYKVKQDNIPFKKGDVVRFVKHELRKHDKGVYSDIYYFSTEESGLTKKMIHFDDHRSAKLEAIFEEVP